MLNRLIAKIKSRMQARQMFDPTQFNDPIAQQTEWRPAKRGGTNFRTHKLVDVSPYRLEFRVSTAATIFYIFFIVTGLGIAIPFTMVRLSAGDFGVNPETIAPLAMGVVFTIVGVVMFYFGTRPIVFDQSKGYFWKGRKSPDEIYNRDQLKHFAELHNIHALQIISEYVRSDKSSYYSYELNLVLKDASRINVIDHGNRNKLLEDAEKLSAFLGKKIWDAS
ncbi:hypothetical protein JW960_17970 [candidate division KSB1 bacterium]|nr:hypothetical protein [candidate division KSB1 bacterium]